VTLRVGLIGAGFARRVQLPGLRLVSGITPVAIASCHRANADIAAREFGISNVFDDGIELARSPDVDLVLVSSTPPSHVEYAIAALEAGKHVLCEKPMALDAAEAWRMVVAAERQPSCVAWIDHELRYEPNRRKIKDLIRAGAIGEVRHMELTLKPYLRGDGRPHTSAAPWTWWYDRSQGGGILGAVGSHLIDLCRFWTGCEVTYASGRVATFLRKRRDAAGVTRPVTADELVSGVLSLGDDVVATVTLSAVARHGTGHLAQITGSEGTLLLTGETKLEIGKAGGPFEDISIPDDLIGQTTVNNMWARSFVRLMRDFAGVIMGAAPTGEPAGFRDGWQIQRVLDALRSGPGTPLD
jgi:predicted dehydrogenase